MKRDNIITSALMAMIIGGILGMTISAATMIGYGIYGMFSAMSLEAVFVSLGIGIIFALFAMVTAIRIRDLTKN